MVLSLIYGKKYAQSQVGIVTFDTMVTEEHRYSATATHYPVERGTIITDHILLYPTVVVLSGLITDSPLNIFAPYNRSIAAFNALVNIFQNRQIVQVTTGIKVYNQMCITSLDVPRTIKTGQTLTFNIELQAINFIEDVLVYSENGNVQAGVQDTTSSTIVAENNNIPYIQNDPAFSLKDQASSTVNVGIQSLDTVPPNILPNVTTNALAIKGIA